MRERARDRLRANNNDNNNNNSNNNTSAGLGVAWEAGSGGSGGGGVSQSVEICDLPCLVVGPVEANTEGGRDRDLVHGQRREASVNSSSVSSACRHTHFTNRCGHGLCFLERRMVVPPMQSSVW